VDIGFIHPLALVAITPLAYVVAIRAMSTKPS